MLRPTHLSSYRQACQSRCRDIQLLGLPNTAVFATARLVGEQLCETAVHMGLDYSHDLIMNVEMRMTMVDDDELF